MRAHAHPQMESIYIHTHLRMEASVHVTRLLLPDWSSSLCWSGAAKHGDLGPPQSPDLLPLETNPLLEWREPALSRPGRPCAAGPPRWC